MLLEAGGEDGDPLELVAGWRTAVAELVAGGLLPAPHEVVPGACTLLLDGVDAAAVGALLAVELRARRGLGGPGERSEASGPADGPVVQVPVVYDGADLAEVAALWGVSEQGVVARHISAEFRVAFCGFAPGFPYLVGPGQPVPRRTTPRAAVPAGSVALAGRYCGIYPTCSPGGWQLIGTTDLPLFAADRDPPALLPPGTRVRFVPVAARSNTARTGTVAAGGRRSRTVTVVRAGALTTVQDGGRVGLAHLGVPRAGALDPGSAQLANRLLGNPEDAAVLETTLNGVTLRADVALTVAVTGAGANLTVAGNPARWGQPVDLASGDVLQVGPARIGVRSYVAFAGGLTVPSVLGSRSRDTLSGLGPAPLADGDALPVGDPAPRATATGTTSATPETAKTPPVGEPVVLRLTPGPRDDWFGAPGLATLLAGPYTLSPTSNRVGARLSGPPVPRLPQRELDSEGTVREPDSKGTVRELDIEGTVRELDSEGMVLGAVQVPPDGQPVILLADHPTTGGYPVIGVIEPGDLSLLAQARPGAAVHVALDDCSGRKVMR